MDRAVSSIRSYLQALLGTYTPSANGTSLAYADWEYIFGAILLCMIFYFVLKLFFVLVKR